MTQLVQKYLLPSTKYSDYVILIICLLLIIGTWALILAFTAKGSNIIVAYEVCKPGDCPTNRFTGEKRCPSGNQTPLQYDPILEVCNPSKSCTANSTPNAVQSDGSTNISGDCDIDQCRCVTYLTTPSYIEVLFNTQGANVYTTDPTQLTNLQFFQQPSPYPGEGNNVPILYQDPTKQFWEIAPSDLGYLSPNPCSELFSSGPELSTENLMKCINLNPCLVGRLAYLPKNTTAFANFSKSASNLTGGVPLGCVPNRVDKLSSPTGSNSCSPASTDVTYKVPVFNTVSGEVTCIRTNVGITQ